MSFPYLSAGTFLRAPLRDKSHRLAVAGIPWDGCVTNRPGARFGPSGIRASSLMLCDGLHPLFEDSPEFKMTDYGDLELPNTSLEAMRSAMMPLVTPLVRDHHMIWLGGDHSVTLPLLRAYKQVLGHPVAVLHFDAHCDTWKDHFGEPSGHGTWVYEAVQEKLVDPRCFFQFGIRSSGERNAREYVNDQGGMVFTARMLRGKDGAEGMKPVVEKVLQRLREHGNPKVYVTFDIDCLDPSFAPGTGTPEPGGLSSSQALSLLEAFCAMIPDQMIGFDVMEVAPVYDNAELTTSAAATLAWTYMSAQVALQNRGIEELKKMYAVGNALPQ